MFEDLTIIVIYMSEAVLTTSYMNACYIYSQQACMTQLSILESSCTAPVQSNNKETNKESEAKAQLGEQLPVHLHENFNLFNPVTLYSQSTWWAEVNRSICVSHFTDYKRALRLHSSLLGELQWTS